jgi:hypothetical protein
MIIDREPEEIELPFFSSSTSERLLYTVEKCLEIPTISQLADCSLVNMNINSLGLEAQIWGIETTFLDPDIHPYKLPDLPTPHVKCDLLELLKQQTIQIPSASAVKLNTLFCADTIFATLQVLLPQPEEQPVQLANFPSLDYYMKYEPNPIDVPEEIITEPVVEYFTKVCEATPCSLT